MSTGNMHRAGHEAWKVSEGGVEEKESTLTMVSDACWRRQVGKMSFEYGRYLAPATVGRIQR